MKEIKGAIFDMDGTLIDSMYIWDTVGEKYLRSQGKTAGDGLQEQLRTSSLIQAAQLFQTEYQIPLSIEEILNGFNGIVQYEYNTNVTLKAGAVDLLAQLAEKNIDLSIATSSPASIAYAVLKRLGIDLYFSHILTCTDVGQGKDHPAIFYQAAQLMGTDQSNTIIFEDALHAVTTAKSAGYYVVGVFDASESFHRDQIASLCDQYIITLEDFVFPV